MATKLLLSFLIVLCCATSVGQISVEHGSSAGDDSSLIVGKGPSRDSVPSWAAPGRIRFSRWDGGRIETAKSMLSGYPGFNPPNPDIVESTTNWYQPETIQYLKRAGVNLIWVTFSNGFSNETERAHQEQVRAYIEECHRQGIHVMAYESISNLFWEDMFKIQPESKGWIAHDKQGRAIPYGGEVDYSKLGRVTRYLADLRNPQWRTYLRSRIDLAIDAGADGIMYDNNFGEGLPGLYDEIQRYASTRKKDFLITANFHDDTYYVNRVINCITTEDGHEPGLWTKRPPDVWGGILDLEKGHLVNNIGLMRVHETLSEGWKPVMVENGTRESYGRLLGLMSARRSQLSLAESMTFAIANELFVEGEVALQLQTDNIETRKIWDAIGSYNRFFADHEDLYVGMRSRADIAVVVEDARPQVPVLNGLAARGVLFNVVFEGNVEAELKKYKAAILLAQRVSKATLFQLHQFSGRGGVLVAVDQAARFDEQGKSIERPMFLGSVGFRGSADFDSLVHAINNADGQKFVNVDAPSAVLFNVTANSDQRRLLIHLLNYSLESVSAVNLTVQGDFKSVQIMSPDLHPATLPVISHTAGHTLIQVPRLDIYSVVVLEPAP